MDIREENESDYAAIAEVVEAAFGRPNEARLVELIRASDAYVPELSLVAEVDGAVVGHVMFSYVTLRAEEELRVLCMAPVSVAPAWQGGGGGGAARARAGPSRVLPAIRFRTRAAARYRAAVAGDTRRRLHGAATASVRRPLPRTARV